MTEEEQLRQEEVSAAAEQVLKTPRSTPAQVRAAFASVDALGSRALSLGIRRRYGHTLKMAEQTNEQERLLALRQIGER
jgi:hypothetical protein